MESVERSTLRSRITEFFDTTWNSPQLLQKFEQDLDELDNMKGQLACIMRDYQDLLEPKGNATTPISISYRTVSMDADKMRSRSPMGAGAVKSRLHHDENQKRKEVTQMDRSKTPEPGSNKPAKHDKEKQQPQGHSQLQAPKEKEKEKEKEPKHKRKPLTIATDKLEMDMQKPVANKRDMTPLAKTKFLKESEVTNKYNDDMQDQYTAIHGNKKATTVKRKDTKKLKEDGTILNFNKNVSLTSESFNKTNGRLSSIDTKRLPIGERKTKKLKTEIHVKKQNAQTKSEKKDEGNVEMADQMNDSFHVDEKKELQDKLNEIKMQNEKRIREIIQSQEMKRINFSNKWLECLYIVGCSKVVPFDLRILFHTSTPEIYEKQGLKQLILEKIEKIELEIKDRENILGVYDLCRDSIINKLFAPSKTAQNGLNFITKEEENNLCRREQPEEVLNIFRAIYIFLGENHKDIPPQKLIENLLTVIFKKYGVDSLKSLCLGKIAKNTNISESQFEELISLFKDNPAMFSSGDILRINRSVSYMTFILKEMYEYTAAKLNDGSFAFYMRKLILEINSLKDQISRLKSFLN